MTDYGKTVPRSFLNECGEPVGIKVQRGERSVNLTIRRPHDTSHLTVTHTEAKQLLLALMEVFEE